MNKQETFEAVRREFNKLLSENVVDGLPTPPTPRRVNGYDDVTFDAVMVGDESWRKEPDIRARYLFAEWLVAVIQWRHEHGTKHTDDYDCAMLATLTYLIGTNSTVSRKPPPPKPSEFCPHCNVHIVSGATRAQVEAQRAERVAIERETGLRS